MLCSPSSTYSFVRLITILFAISVAVIAQANWPQSLSLPASNLVSHSVAVTTKGHVYVSTTDGVNQLSVTKFSSAGQHLWTHSFTVDAYSFSVRKSICDNSDSVYIAAKITKGQNLRKNLPVNFLYRISASGTMLWSRKIASKSYPQDICASTSSGVILAFCSGITVYSDGDYQGNIRDCVSRISPAGVIQWTNSDVASTRGDFPSLTVSSTGAIATTTWGFGGSRVTWYSKTGSLLYNQDSGATGWNRGPSIAFDHEDDLIVSVSKANGESVQVSKITPEGILWTRTYSNGAEPVFGFLYSISVTVDILDNPIVAFWASATGAVHLVKFDSEGNQLWAKPLELLPGLANVQGISGLLTDRDGNIMVTRWFRGQEDPQSYAVYKFRPDGHRYSLTLTPWPAQGIAATVTLNPFNQKLLVSSSQYSSDTHEIKITIESY